MLPKILRIGPLFLLEVGLLIASLVVVIIGRLTPCQLYALLTISFSAFIFQMFVALRMIRKSKKLRKEYVSKLIISTQIEYYSVNLWNSIMFFTPIIFIYTIIILDGITLSSFQTNQPQCQNDCNFLLFPLCFYNSAFGKLIKVHDQLMVLGMLYTCSLVAFLFLTIMMFKQLYKYFRTLKENRKLSKDGNITMFQSLINCQIYQEKLKINLDQNNIIINQTVLSIKDQIQNQIDQNQNQNQNKINEKSISIIIKQFDSCSICLKPMKLVKPIIKNVQILPIIQLQCGHYFHKKCILEWLQIKDNCPFRCGKQ